MTHEKPKILYMKGVVSHATFNSARSSLNLSFSFLGVYAIFAMECFCRIKLCFENQIYNITTFSRFIIL